MNYLKCYINLINKRKNIQILDNTKNTEIHHIIPIACNGVNTQRNLVCLTLKEHFVAHHLLIKIYENTEFEEKFTELQADMVDICNEYSKGLADKIFIYAANEGMILTHHFYCINNKIFDCQKLNESGLQTEFDVSKDCQGQVLDTLNEDIQNLYIHQIQKIEEFIKGFILLNI